MVLVVRVLVLVLVIVVLILVVVVAVAVVVVVVVAVVVVVVVAVVVVVDVCMTACNTRVCIHTPYRTPRSTPSDALRLPPPGVPHSRTRPRPRRSAARHL